MHVEEVFTLIGIVLVGISIYLIKFKAPKQAEKEIRARIIKSQTKKAKYEIAIANAKNQKELTEITTDIILDGSIKAIEEGQLFDLIEQKQQSWNRK